MTLTAKEKTSTTFVKGYNDALAGKPVTANPFEPGYFHNNYIRGHAKGCKAKAKKPSKGKWL